MTAHSGFEELKAHVADFSPEKMAPICGIPAETLREVARMYATAKNLDDPLGHGHQPARARHRQRALPDRARLITGQIGRPAPACIRCADRTTCRARPTPA
jgi:formate dehydrogenase major subunit